MLDISRDDAVIEDRARSELGMIKRGETFYQVILNSDTKTELVQPTTPATGVPSYVE